MMFDVSSGFDLQDKSVEKICDFIDERLSLAEKNKIDLREELTDGEMERLMEILEEETKREPKSCLGGMYLCSLEFCMKG